MKETVIHSGRVIAPEGILDGGSVHIRDNRIARVSAERLYVPGAVEIDAKGRYVSPGFVDIHVHGGDGAYFPQGTPDAFEAVTKLHCRYGVTSLQVTPAALPFEGFATLFTGYRQWLEEGRSGGADILGIHLEGPFFNLAQRGAQPPQFIRDPTADDIAYLLDNADIINEMTIAPEVPGALEMIRALSDHGILMSAGHSDAREVDMLKAIDAGLRHVTHIYSGMSSMIRVGPWRVPGVLEVGLTHPDLTIEMIADGCHLPATLLKLITRCRGTDRICIVSDAIRGAGLPEGLEFAFEGQEAIVEQGVAIMADRTCFVGSIQPVGRMVGNVLRLVGTSLIETVAMATSIPAKVIGVDDRKGSLRTDKDADVTIFDDDINCNMTMVGGEIVYQNDL
jgi:N-acetylglucosamine-6-phosphate deacetylase